jgi:hypothetical protein
MSKSALKCLQLMALAAVVAVTAPALAQFRYSEYGGGQQFWIPGGAFSARSMDGGSPNFHQDPAANDPLSGSAYFFGTPLGQESLGGDQRDWWVQYDVPRSALPAGWDISGTWGFWVRTQIATADEYGGSPGGNPDMFWESAYLFVNGHPTDLNVDNPTEADWQGALAGRNNADDRVLQNHIWVDPAYVGGVRPNWTWLNTIQPDDRDFMVKTLAVHDDKISFRLYERESSVYAGRVDVIVFARIDDPENPDYEPSDADFLNAVPEPASLLLALPMFLMFRRRR